MNSAHVHTAKLSQVRVPGLRLAGRMRMRRVVRICAEEWTATKENNPRKYKWLRGSPLQRTTYNEALDIFFYCRSPPVIGLIGYGTIWTKCSETAFPF